MELNLRPLNLWSRDFLNVNQSQEQRHEETDKANFQQP